MMEERRASILAKGLESLKRFLNENCKEFNYQKRLLNDPVEFLHRYENKEDIEVSGFISALFAYGRVGLFKPVIEKILNAMGESPYEFLIDFKPERERSHFRGVYYRFQKEKDILELLRLTGLILKKHKSIERAFYAFYSSEDTDTEKAIEGFSGYILELSGLKTLGLSQLFPLPSRGSACKRMNLFLRWMVRKDEVDLGLWKGIPKDKLIIPLDVHIARIAIRFGLTKRQTPDIKMAKEITSALKLLDPEDPLKYDFMLCHTGMMDQVRR